MVIYVKVAVPGTTANCGPGFDSVGIACTIYNYVELELHKDVNKFQIKVSGEGYDSIPLDDSNIVLQSVRTVLKKAGMTECGIVLKMQNNIPLARGLGSSAAAIVGGLVAANAATGAKLTKQELLELATEFEGHPDNVAPAIFGGVTVSVAEKSVQCLQFLPPKELIMVVAVPDFPLATSAARSVLPRMLPFGDAVFNTSRTGLLVASLCKGEFQYLKYALKDKIHQPYRMKLIPGMDDVFKAAVSKGAFGAAISGAGPCLIAYTDHNAEVIGEAMIQAFAVHQVSAKYLMLRIDTEGAKVIGKITS